MLGVNEYKDVLSSKSKSKGCPLLLQNSIHGPYLSWMMKYFKGSVALLLGVA